MDQHHSPALDRLIRRQRVGGESGSLPNADSSPSSTPSLAPVASTTTTTQAPSTTSVAPVTSSTTSSPPVVETSSTSSVPPSSSSTTTTTTPVQETSSVAPSSSSTTTTTTTPSTTSTTTTSARSTIVAQDTTSEAETAFSTSARTTVVVVSGSASSTSSSASLASATAGTSDSSIGTGGVIGIVAGAVVGVVFVAALIAFLFKKYSRKNDDDQISPFDKDEFRRASVMLDDDDAYPESYHQPGGGVGHSPQMSEYSMSNVGVGAVLPGLARGGTLNNPRPPTAIMNHYQHQQMMPSFQPGQVVPTSPSPPMHYGQQFNGNHSPPLGGNYAPMDPYAYPQQPQAAQFADQTGGLSTAAAGHWNGIAPPMHANNDLSRNNSQMSSYSQYSDGGNHHGSRQIVPPALRPGGSSHGHPDERPLSLVHEDDEPYSPSHGSFSRHQQQQGQRSSRSSPVDHIPQRSGTPTNSNVQQTFFGAQGVTTAETGNDWEKEEREREQRRRLSIRNGGLDQFDREDDPYDGMHW